MRPNRWCRLRGGLLGVCAALSLGLAACGGSGSGSAAAPGADAPGSLAPSPQRPSLASPSASPSALPGVVGATPSASASPSAGGDSYTVQSGDTLATIAQQFYGDPAQWQRIYDANKDAVGANPDQLKQGTKLTIPPKQS